MSSLFRSKTLRVELCARSSATTLIGTKLNRCSWNLIIAAPRALKFIMKKHL